ncbi:MAG: thioredoxin-disulfide reductase [Desulfomonilia bacterium]|nr:thioredoxin-disulfide reductase [Desulfomonilia bacterium]
MYDILIVGSGPAGLTAGMYASRAAMRTLLLASAYHPSLITTTDLIENYPGFPEGISGFELVEKFREQAEKFGLEFIQDDAVSLEKTSKNGAPAWKVTTSGSSFEALALIIATGTEYAHLNVKGEEELTGRGVSYCATCDGPFFKDAHLVVVGGGDTAVQEALFLTRFARKVTIVHRRDRLRATGILRQRAHDHERISFEWNAVVTEIMGESAVTGVKIRNVKNPEDEKVLKAEGVFIFTGYIPYTSFLHGILALDEVGYIVVDAEMKTSAPGIFACGDCTKKLLRQVVTACGDGATAAFSAEHYVNELKGTSYGTWDNH